MSDVKKNILERSVEGKDGVEIKGDTIIHIREPQVYKKLWNAFLENELEEFSKHMGYGKNAIERVGVEKFIDAMDWVDEKDVSKWKTDVYNIVICPDCNSEFGIFQTVGICQRCIKSYDMNKMTEMLNVSSKYSEQLPAYLNELLFINKELRDDFKKKEGVKESDTKKG